MGCNGSKPSQKVQDPAKIENAQARKTLLGAELVAEPVKLVEAERQSAQVVEGLPAKLKVTVLSARGLRNLLWLDSVGKPDAYCVCEVSDHPRARLETPVVNDKLNPKWNYDGDISGYRTGKAITFIVRSKHPFKPSECDELLGKVTLASAQFSEDAFEGELPLTDTAEGVDAFLKVKVAVVHPKVKVTTAGAIELPDCFADADPYCVCEVPGKPESEIHTTTVGIASPKHDDDTEVVDYLADGKDTFAALADGGEKVAEPLEAPVDVVVESEGYQSKSCWCGA